MVLLDGDEAALLRGADEVLADLGPGVLVTWNGAAFDLPFVATRARLLDVDLDLRLRLDPALDVRRPLPGHDGAYRGRWHGLVHLDAYRVWRNDLHRTFGGLSCSLKSVARVCGLRPVEEDRTSLHRLDGRRLSDYVRSDAVLARELAGRRWRTAVRFVDPPDPATMARSA